MDEPTTPCPRCGGPRFWYRGKAQNKQRCRPCLATAARKRYCANREAEIARGRAWREANADKMQACRRGWRDANRASVTAYNAAYYDANREAEIARALAYTRAHPEVDAAIKHRREARKRDAVCEHGPHCVDAAFMAAIRAGRCLYCTKPAQQADHFHPLSRGGLHCRENIVPACRSCNARKRDKDPEVWLSSITS